MSDKIRRLKETLESVTKSSSKVFIVGHDEPDEKNGEHDGRKEPLDE